MQMNDSRLFKATRRTFRAEVTLIIVIVISFSWSAYALYKLVVVGGNFDGSLFGLSSPAPKAQQVSPAPPTQDQLPVVGLQSQISAQDLSEQLAAYKRQILKELLERQRKLLADSAQEPHELHSSTSDQFQRSPYNPNGHQQQPNIEELNQWRGANFKMPSSLDYLFEAKKRPHAHSFGDRTASGSSVVQSRQVPLADAPSLMQLAARPMQMRERVTKEPDDNDDNTQRWHKVAPTKISIEPEVTPDETTTTTTPSPESGDDSTTPTPTEAPASGSETTTVEPTLPSEEGAQSAGDNEETDKSSEVPPPQSSGDPATGSANDNNVDDDDNGQSMEGVKKTVHAIDEEVDRMTQPTLGMASQQEKSFDYNKNTVHFDDTPQVSADRKSTKKHRRENSIPEVASDLQVADNRPMKPPAAAVREESAPSKLPVQVTHLARKTPTLLSNTSARHKRSVEKNLIAQTLNSLDPKLKRRSDNDDDNDDDDVDEGVEGDDSREGEGNKYQHLTSSDPTLEDLLAHKQLLDALQQSKLPAPINTTSSTNVQPPRLVHSTPTPTPKAISNQDHEPAGAQYTVDHGLLLYPAEDEEHHYKSKSKKSKKMAMKKGKKKMTVAMKKGGHKKKKHKKEEKKYLKEKKFKGAKKGKKMSKGKGGKGGKKGKKFYKDKGFKKKGFKNIYVKNEFGQKKSYFDEFRDKDFKKKWKNYDDKYKYANMKKWQAKDVKGAKKMKQQGEKYNKYDKGKWKKKYHKHQASESAKKKKKEDDF